MANLPGSIKNLNTLLGEQLLEGGGGSSDFSTAQVTVINNSSSELSSTNLIVIYPDDEFLSNGFATDPNSQNIYNILLYKGQAEIYDLKKNGNPMTDGTGITVSGNIENRSDETEVYMLITGDCTITIS